MRLSKTRQKIFALSISACLLCWGVVLAKGKPGGGGNGGAGGTTAPYTLVDLGGFTGGDLIQAQALDVNNPDADGNLMVAGYSYVPVPGLRNEHAAVWDVSASGQVLSLTDIAPPDYQNSRARRINELGYVLVGGYVWIPSSGLLTLPGLGGGNGSPGLLDDLGNVYGSAPDAEGVDHPVAWHITPEGGITGPTDLGDLGDFRAWDVNNNGVMAGYVNPDAAIAWFDDLGQIHLQVLGGLGPNDVAQAIAVNDNGMVVGNSRDPSGYQEAFVWTAETGMISLGTLGGPESTATDINNSGQIVGWSRSSGRFPEVGFLWQNGQMFDLNTITDGGGGQNWIQKASGINDEGHIVGLLHKTKPTSEDHALLLVPNVP